MVAHRFTRDDLIGIVVFEGERIFRGRTLVADDRNSFESVAHVGGKIIRAAARLEWKILRPVNVLPRVPPAELT
jgi:hypothetical protein